MKNTSNILALALTIFTFTSVFTSMAQQGKIWAVVQSSALPVYINNQLVSTDAAFNQAISNLNINSVEKALPASKNQNLQNVYEITCACDESDLYATLVNNVSVVTGETYSPKYQTLNTPNDYLATFASDYALDLINAQGAWNFTQGTSNVTIAISDQNFYQNHEELAGKVVFYDTTNTATRTHGTAVAILAAGNTNNGVGKSSIGYNSQVSLYRMNYNDVLAASYAGAKVVNLSWTSGCSFNQYAQDAINEVYNNGTFVIAAAGNGTTCGGADNLVYPAAFENVFSVTSIGPNDNHERTIGNPSTTHQHNNTVDLSAPGYDVAISAAPGWYLTNSGTSYAAPQVSGTVALMLAVNPCLTNANIEFILKQSAVNINNLNPVYAGKIGAGRLNAAAAVEMAYNWVSVRVEATISTTCAVNSGQIELNINGTAPFQAIWNTGETGLVIDSLAGGAYTVTVTDALGCTIDTTLFVNEVVPMAFEAEITNVTCNGLANGAINLTMTQGNAVSFWWDVNDFTSEDLTNLSAGEYKVKITNENGCTTFGSFTVTEPDALVATIDATQFTAYQETALDLTIVGGIAPYEVMWNNNVTTEDQVNVTGGNYFAIVTDANGCQTNANATIDAYTPTDTTGQEGENVALVIEEELNFVVFPNPANDNATVQWKGTAQELKLFNAAGQLLENENVEDTNSFKFQYLSNGIYYIQLVINNTNKNIKLVVQ
jgi:subtilisin family serine protease